MARYKDKRFQQGQFISVDSNDQIPPGTFKHILHHLVENILDLSVFDTRYRNDETCASAYNSMPLFNIILYTYSSGIVPIRKIAQCCGMSRFL